MILEINIGKIEYELGLKWERNNGKKLEKYSANFTDLR